MHLFLNLSYKGRCEKKEEKQGDGSRASSKEQ